MIGKTISHYKILEKLGEGGMGVVYRAHDTRLDRDVALKFLPAHMDASAAEISRFEQEARAISTLNHPGIETIYDVDETNGQKYLVLEYIPGGTLKAKLKQLKSEDKRFSIAEVLDYGIQLAEGLAHAHRHQIVHRDVKTDNIMLTEEGKVKLTDFGLAKLRGTVHKTKSGSTLGTVAYMSPEQVRGEEADQRSDLFSMGVVLYELLTTHLPFKGEYEAAVSYGILNEQPPSIRSVRPDVPPALEKIIDRCLEKDPEKRFQRAEEMIADLRIMQQQTTRILVEKKNKSWIPLFVGSAVCILTAAVLAYLFLRPKSVPSREKSIAVLPFVDMSPQNDQAYFCDGMTEELINRLSHIQGLRVPARTSVFYFKGKTEDIREIGNKLNVKTVLEGSVRKSDNELRITAQLISVSDGYHLWSETYNRPLEGIFTIQDEISSAIVNALKLRLTSQETQRLSEHPIDDIKAYDCYLKAERLILHYDEKSLDSAIVYLQTAIDIMGENAQLFAGMAYACWQYTNMGIGQEEYLKRSEEYIKKALDIQPDLSSALAMLGMFYIYEEYPQNIIDAIRTFKKALESNPFEQRALTGLAICYSITGKASEAYATVDIMKAHDPLNPWWHSILSDCYQYDCQFYAALEQSRLYYQAERTSPMAIGNYSWALTSNGMRDEALAVINDAGPESTRNVQTVFYLLLKYALLKDKESAWRLMTTEFQKTCRRDAEWSYILAERLSLLGTKKEALDWLENAINRGFIDYPLFQCDPFLDGIRGEEQFRKLMEHAKYEWEYFEVPK
jgi:serine/threonine protein kinase/Tfp pilus assembly protein PilF